MFSRYRQRLMREGMTVQELCEELYAMFGPDTPLHHDGPITLTVQEQNGIKFAPITVRGTETGDVLVKVTQAEEAVEPEEVNNDIVAGTITEAGYLKPGYAMPGVVLAPISSAPQDNHYSVRIYPNGILEEGTIVEAVSGEPGIISGTWRIMVVLPDTAGYTYGF